MKSLSNSSTAILKGAFSLVDLAVSAILGIMWFLLN